MIRDWTLTDAEGNATTCSQTFTFNKIRISELTPPAQEVVLTCGMDASPENIAGFFDVDSRTPNTGVTNIGPFNDDWSQTPAVVELNEGYKFGYFTYQLPGFNIVPATAPNLHDQKVHRDICGIYTSYSDDVFPACGNGCGGNMKIIRTWKVLDWCTKEVSEYFQVIKAVDQKAPTFDVNYSDWAYQVRRCLSGLSYDSINRTFA